MWFALNLMFKSLVYIVRRPFAVHFSYTQKVYSGLKTSSHNCMAISSSIVCHGTSDSNFWNPRGDSICNSFRLFRLFTDPSAFLRMLPSSAPLPRQNPSWLLCIFSTPFVWLLRVRFASFVERAPILIWITLAHVLCKFAGINFVMNGKQTGCSTIELVLLSANILRHLIDFDK